MGKGGRIISINYCTAAAAAAAAERLLATIQYVPPQVGEFLFLPSPAACECGRRLLSLSEIAERVCVYVYILKFCYRFY
jgi:hypothetical protein